ncbi:hypothetical protein, partial [Pleomorphomonas sp. JP5]|uniref:hypothetical protein n=1 Tax=Pleomorphomonas sp. JP5 TaxID=2942998 RepID=UPI002043D75A
LLFAETTALHVLVLSMGQNELQTGLGSRGNVIEKAGFRLTGEHTRASPNRQGNLIVLRYQRDL